MKTIKLLPLYQILAGLHMGTISYDEMPFIKESEDYILPHQLTVPSEVTRLNMEMSITFKPCRVHESLCEQAALTTYRNLCAFLKKE